MHQGARYVRHRRTLFRSGRHRVIGERRFPDMRWYAVALAGLAAGVLQVYMLLTMPAHPPSDSFRAWISVVGFVAGVACLVVIPGYLGVSLWKLWSDRPAQAVQR